MKTRTKLKIASSFIKLKLENRQLKHVIKQLRKEIVKDHLTGLYNPMALDSFLKEQASLAQRYHLPLSVIMIDFDNLKKYNDKYGHLQGNEAIKTAAKAMRKSLRDSDILGRWTSGEEFLVILPETNKNGALKLAEKIRINVERAKIKATSNDLKPGYKWITVSIGVAEFTINQKKMLKQADEAMYKAKSAGRNKVVVI